MESLVIYGVVNEDVLFLVDGKKMTTVTIFNNLAVWNLNVFKDLDLVIDDGKDFESG